MDIQARDLQFKTAGFDGCCQAITLYNLWISNASTEGKPTITKHQLDIAEEMILAGRHYLIFAVTSTEQVEWEFILEKLGFTKQRQYTARTGSLLTAWVFVPEDQEYYEDEGDEEDDDY